MVKYVCLEGNEITKRIFPLSQMTCRDRVEKLKKAFEHRRGNGSSQSGESAITSRNGRAVTIPSKKGRRQGGLAKWGLQGRVLLQRSWRQIKRDKATNVARVMSNVSSAIIFGSIYWRLGRKQIAVQNRLGLLQVYCCTPNPACPPNLAANCCTPFLV